MTVSEASKLAPIIIMAGGTGGHIFPALAVAKVLRAENCQVTWIGTPNSMEARLVPQHGFNIRYIDIKALRGKGLGAKLLLPFRLVKAVVQALKIIKHIKPAAILGMGGFVTGPGGIAAWLCRKPLLVHEQNAVAGMTNSYLAKLARHVYEAFPSSFKNLPSAIEVGNPLRSEIKALHKAQKEKFANQRPLHLLIVGGSLGAQILNEVVPQALAKISSEKLLANTQIDIRHQTGQKTHQHAVDAYSKAGIEAEIIEFIDDMAEAYTWADIIICRAGALTVSEVSAAGLPAIFVPFPLAVDDHQRKNAEVLVAAGAAKIIIQKDLSVKSLAHALTQISTDSVSLNAMSSKAKAVAKMDAENIISKQCLEYARRVA